MEDIGHIREALEKRGFDDRTFLREIRDGQHDDGPYMPGALAWDERVRHANP